MKKMNNKGFSLVELIIVIAIMAILVGVLAPQYIKYVERSRESTDIQTLDSIKKALETCVIDPTIDVASDFTVTFDSEHGVGGPGTGTTLKTEMETILGDLGGITPKSTKFDGAVDIYYNGTTVYFCEHGDSSAKIADLNDF